MFRRLALLMILPLACIAGAACGDDSTSSPTPDAGTPTPVPSTTVWRISGEIDQNLDMSVFSCTALPGYYQVLLIGQVSDGQGMSIFVFTPNSGTSNLADVASGMTITVQLHAEDNSINSLWQATSGTSGATGTVVMDTDASGSLTAIVVPPGATGAGGATEPITVNGEWKCPFAVPTA